MTVNEKFTDAAPAATERSELQPGEGETAALGVAIGGFQEAMETKGGRLLMTATKVLLFNAAIFLPLIAAGGVLFFM